MSDRFVRAALVYYYCFLRDEPALITLQRKLALCLVAKLKILKHLILSGIRGVAMACSRRPFAGAGLVGFPAMAQPIRKASSSNAPSLITIPVSLTASGRQSKTVCREYRA
jgi:hypothetical protein